MAYFGEAVTIAGGTAGAKKIVYAGSAIDINNSKLLVKDTGRIELANDLRINGSVSVDEASHLRQSFVGGISYFISYGADNSTGGGFSFITRSANGSGVNTEALSIAATTGAVTAPVSFTTSQLSAVEATTSANITIDSKSGTSYRSNIYFKTAGSTRWFVQSGQAYTDFGGGADTFNIMNAAGTPVIWATQAGAVTVPVSLTIGTAGTPTGYTPTALSVYQTGTFSITLNVGMYTTDTAITVKYTRVGNVVTLSFPFTYVTANATSNKWETSTTTVPAHLRPAADQVNIIAILKNSVVLPGTFTVDTAGKATFSANINSGTWTSGETVSGFYPVSVTYNI